MHSNTIWIKLAMAAGIVCSAAPLHAQDIYPSRPIRVIVPLPPGTATDFIARHQDKPFFLYLAHAAPHVPLQGRDPNQKKPPAETYQEMVGIMDESVGTIAEALRKHRQALAGADRASMAVLAAQIAQTEAQIALVEDRLARATVMAPFAGIVVSGDLTQLLGAPVEQGRQLFQIAPLDSYRVILEVDERDIDAVVVIGDLLRDQTHGEAPL